MCLDLGAVWSVWVVTTYVRGDGCVFGEVECVGLDRGRLGYLLEGRRGGRIGRISSSGLLERS